MASTACPCRHVREVAPVGQPVRHPWADGSPSLIGGGIPLTSWRHLAMSTVMSTAMSGSWPSSPLGAVARAFDLLTCPPVPLAFDARGLPALPQRVLPLNELRDLLTTDTTPKPIRDLVWRGLVARSRRDGPAWVVAAAGIALPGLRVQAGRIAARWRGDTLDLDAELLAGFVERLATIDIDAPRICGRLIDAGARAAKRSRLAEEETMAIRVDGAWSR